jgi:hypothetical protein
VLVLELVALDEGAEVEPLEVPVGVVEPPLPAVPVFLVAPVDELVLGVDEPVLGDVFEPLVVPAEFPVLVAPLLSVVWPLLLLP